MWRYRKVIMQLCDAANLDPGDGRASTLCLHLNVVAHTVVALSSYQGRIRPRIYEIDVERSLAAF